MFLRGIMSELIMLDPLLDGTGNQYIKQLRDGGINMLAEQVVSRFIEATSEFKPGDHVKVKSTHGYPKFRGDIGIIEKYVPFGKYYVELKRNGRAMVSEDDLEKI